MYSSIMQQAIVAYILLMLATASATLTRYPYNEQETTADYWKKLGRADIEAALHKPIIAHEGESAILFLGDGMGVSTLTAARILKGQVQNRSGEEGYLHFERFPNAALLKTYNVNKQVPDSAGTATAYLSGIKANFEVIGLGPALNSSEKDCDKIKANYVDSILAMAVKSGKAAGVVTTTRITHATPAASYAHVSHRDWEADVDVPAETYAGGCKDIAHQLIDGEPGRHLKVILGGGAKNFYTKSEGGVRNDANLVQRWKLNKQQSGLQSDQYVFVNNSQQLKNVDYSKVDSLFGLFAESHMDYEYQRNQANDGQPSLAEMVEAAIKVLSKSKTGFVLLVEGGRIDHAHHTNNALLSLYDTLAFDTAIKKADTMVNKDNTLLVVTADHSHTFTLNGYPERGNNIFGFSGEVEVDSNKPFTTLMYANGPGYTNPRHVPSDQELLDPNYKQHSGVHYNEAAHGGEDVALYSTGPFAHLFHRNHEQSYVAHVMAFSVCMGDYKNAPHCNSQFPVTNGGYQPPHSPVRHVVSLSGK